ncbi:MULTISPECIES: type III secretion HpaP family protein [unclassified Cupriavidus]|uniref:type III secretion HpaP family protein n=1 Tax=unclassified Cupriavidus TaxID=2640874 RepID=UPI00313D318B
MTRTPTPMPPVRIVPASTSEDRAAADAQAREAGNRFRRMLDAQQRRAAAAVMPSGGVWHEPMSDPAPTLAEPPRHALEALWADARQHADREPRPAPEERDAEAAETSHGGGKPDATSHSAGAPLRGEARESGLASGAAGFPSRDGLGGIVKPAGLAGGRFVDRSVAQFARQRPPLAPVAAPRAGARGSNPDSEAHDRGPRTFPPTFVTQLERDVVEFCGAGDLLSDGSARTVTITPDPRVLPDTQLTMTISPDALSLRFHSESAQSRELLCLHGDTLKSRLALRTGRTVDLAIVSA